MPRLFKSGGGCLFKKFNGIPNSYNCFGSIVRDLNPEFLFKGHDELDRIERVSAMVFHEIGAFDDFVGIDAEVLDHNFLHALGDISPGCLFLILIDSILVPRHLVASAMQCPQLSGAIAQAVGNILQSGWREPARGPPTACYPL